MAVERRLHPRYPLACEVKVMLPDAAEVFPAETTHLSRSSMELGCQLALFNALLKQQQLPYSCRLEFKLPWHPKRWVMDAHMMAHRRLSQQQFVLVLLLRHQDDDQAMLMASLLEQHAGSAEG